MNTKGGKGISKPKNNFVGIVWNTSTIHYHPHQKLSVFDDPPNMP